MSFSIRAATRSDVSRLVALCLEMETHYLGDDAIDEATVRRRLTQWFDTNSDSAMLIAIKDATPVGHAVICPLFPAGNLNTAWFLKDIFVSQTARGEGVGEALIKACAKETVRRKGVRFDLTVDAGNDGARALYERLGAQDTAKTYLRWDGEALAALGNG